jgi:hypothetical protein
MSNEKAHIYAIRTGDTCHYIGKTIRENHEGEIKKSMLQAVYQKQDLRDIVVNSDKIRIESLKQVDLCDWYDEKLLEVVEKYKDSHPLKNAQWMLDGKRGYWQDTKGFWYGKKRDSNTLQKLSESKHKSVEQYDIRGNYINTWESRKRVGEEVFGDYVIKNGSAESRIYKVLSCKTIDKRLYYDSYWFSTAELLQHFGAVPKALNIEAIRAAEKRRRSEMLSERNLEYITRYTVERLDDSGEVVETYDNIRHCGYELRIPSDYVSRICRGTRTNNNYVLRYGKKKRQHVDVSYPRYKSRIKPEKKIKKSYKHTITRTTIEHLKNQEVIATYFGVNEASEVLGLKPQVIRRICTTGYKIKKNLPVLRYGKKLQVVRD